MSLLTFPRPTQPSTFSTLVDLDIEDAIDQLTTQQVRIQRNRFDIQVRDRGNTNDPYVSFSLPSIQGTPEALANAEERIAELLKVSRVPGASGSRAIFIDLSKGHLLVSTSVFFNERNAALGVIDESLTHKVELVQALLTLNDFSAVPTPSEPLIVSISNVPDALLASAEVAINGTRYSLADIQDNLEPLDDQS